MRNKLIIVTFISLFVFAFTATGQIQVDSPYARFNIGSLDPPGSFRSLSMGGTGTAIRDNNSISFTNPASYSSLDTNSFAFDFGLDYGNNVLTNGGSRFTSSDINFGHLLLGFPLAKGWGFATGIVPLSNGYYNIYESVLATDDPVSNGYTSNHTGSGGLTNVFVGSGLNITRNLSIGANMTFLFGEIDRTNQVNFTEVDNVFNDNSTESLHMNGVSFSYGMQYHAQFKNDYFVNLGASWSQSKSYKTTYNNLSYRFTSYGTRDTISNVTNDSARTYIPGTLRLGISFGKKNKFTAAIDFESTQWLKSKIPGSAGYAANTRSLLFGAEYIPDKFSNYSFLSRVEYRIGGHIGNNYVIINNQQIKEYGASFGVGLPMTRTFSKTNIYFDYTRRYGSPNSEFQVENCYTVGISLNFYDFWFVKRKYD